MGMSEGVCLCLCGGKRWKYDTRLRFSCHSEWPHTAFGRCMH